MSIPTNINQTTVTQGLTPTNSAAGPSFASMVTGGVPAAPTLPPSSAGPPLPMDALLDGNAGLANPNVIQSLQDMSSNTVILDANGNVSTPGLRDIDLGNGTILSFDLSTMNAQVSPALDPRSSGGNELYDDSGDSTFTASDCRIMVEVPQTPSFNGSRIQSRVAKQLLEVTTLSISIHRAKSPARAFGHANPRGFARGSRTIAGTLILSKTTAEVLYRFLQSGLVADLTKDTYYSKLDQLPPLDFTLLFSNEEGFVSSQRLLGVEFADDGNVTSIQDMILEQQITWYAADLTPLAPMNFNSFFGVNTTASNATAVQKTPGSVISANAASIDTTDVSNNSTIPSVTTSNLGNLPSTPAVSPANGPGLGGSSIQGPSSGVVPNFGGY